MNEMTKSLMISIKPQHAVNILNGKKTLELRTWIPKGYVGWVYAYVTKSKKDILYKYKDKYYTQHYLTFTDSVEALNSKVVFRFWFDEFIKLEWLDPSLNVKRNDVNYYNYYALFGNVYNNIEWVLPKLCLTKQHVVDYGKGKDLYAWHIKDLEIFDKPKELSEFYNGNRYPNGEIITPNICEFSPFDYDSDLENCLDSFRLNKAPQSYQFVYSIGDEK